MDAEQSLSHPREPSSRARPQRRLPLPHLSGLLVVVGLCWLSWSAPAEAQPACAHDLCETGDNLNSVCDPCVADICDGIPGTMGDPYCCAVEWDDNCVDQVLTICGDVTCNQVCSHSPCEIGDPLDFTCNSCTALVCFQDPNCCTDDGDPLTDDWDASCVQKVQNCGIECIPGEDVCCCANNTCHPDDQEELCSSALPDIPPISLGIVFGTLLGSSNDGTDGEFNSSQAGDVWYAYTAPSVVPPDLLLSTCTTQRSFGIDTVLSVHEGCPGKKNNEIRNNDDHFIGLVPSACTDLGSPVPINLDSAFPMGGFYRIAAGETVVIRVAHHNESVRENFQLTLLPEPVAWQALVAGAGVLGVLWRRRARG